MSRQTSNWRNELPRRFCRLIHGDRAERAGDRCRLEAPRSAALRQSILKKAFTGQLVAQDPSDEPASALLERLRKERATHTLPKKIAKKPATGRMSRKA